MFSRKNSVLVLCFHETFARNTFSMLELFYVFIFQVFLDVVFAILRPKSAPDFSILVQIRCMSGPWCKFFFREIAFLSVLNTFSHFKNLFLAIFELQKMEFGQKNHVHCASKIAL